MAESDDKPEEFAMLDPDIWDGEPWDDETERDNPDDAAARMIERENAATTESEAVPPSMMLGMPFTDFQREFQAQTKGLLWIGFFTGVIYLWWIGRLFSLTAIAFLFPGCMAGFLLTACAAFIKLWLRSLALRQKRSLHV